jgi:hypothetical protein
MSPSSNLKFKAEKLPTNRSNFISFFVSKPATMALNFIDTEKKIT